MIGIFYVFIIQPRILSTNTKVNSDSIYIPKGIANKYNDYLMLSFDDYRIWEYSLNTRETLAVEENINNGIWQKPTKKQYEDIVGVFFEHSLNHNKPDNLSENHENVFYCLYDNALNKFIKIDEGALLGWHRELFLYDKINKTYIIVTHRDSIKKLCNKHYLFEDHMMKEVVEV